MYIYIYNYIMYIHIENMADICVQVSIDEHELKMT